MARLAIAAAIGVVFRAGAQQPTDTSSRRAVVAAVAYTLDAIHDVAGGTRRGTVLAGAADAELTLHLSRIARWRGASVHLSVLGTHGGAPSSLVGDIQGVSSIAAPPVLRLEEVWLQQNLAANRLSVLFGRYDVNSEFYRVHSGELFLNSSLGMGPELAQSGVAGPSTYPNPAVGTRLDVKPSPNAVWRVAMLDGVPVNRPDGGVHFFAPGDGVLIISEIALLARADSTGAPRRRRFLIGRGRTRPYTAKIAFGGWYYTAQFPDLADTLASGDPEQHRGSGGAYLIGDETVWSEGRTPARSLTVFAQVGLGDGRVNPVGRYVGAGASMMAPLTNRAQDELGVAVAAARIGSQLVRAREPLGSTAGETTLELTYLAQFASGFALQPDFQYVLSPSAMRAPRNAVVLGVRGEWSR